MRIVTFFVILFSLNVWGIPIGEQVSDNLKKSVIKIRLFWKSNPDMPCSASVISNRTLLTSAHCVDKIDLRSDIKIVHQDETFKVATIFVPLSYYPEIEQFHSAQTYQERLLYHRSTAQYDIALINLEQDLPASYKPLKISFKKPSVGKQVKVIGVGLTQSSHLLKNVSVNTARMRIGTLHILPNQVLMVKGEHHSDHITAPGDSGGALLEGESLIGVIRGSSSTHLTAASIFTPLWMHKNFILKYMQ